MMHLDGCSVTFDKDSQSGLAFSVSPHACRTPAPERALAPARALPMRNTEQLLLPILLAGLAGAPSRLGLGQS